ncbi:hypothetical protein BaRGS_00022928 [Batillaria attramentaria]|uniref:Uncharacterized protein n=1 Tax=Batillaria attramentaria TaxID=370345 RepID=A0ABD0KF35_9CAEN
MQVLASSCSIDVLPVVLLLFISTLPQTCTVGGNSNTSDISMPEGVTEDQDGNMVDKVGNKADKDSEITFAEFTNYSHYKTKATVIGGSLEAFYSMAYAIAMSGFTKKYPYEIAGTAAKEGDPNKAIEGLGDHGAGWAMGVTAGGLISLLLLICCPVSCCMCCTGRCNRKQIGPKSGDELFFFGGVVFGLAVMASVGPFARCQIAGQTDEAFEETIDNVDRAISDTRLFVDTMVQEIDFTFLKIDFVKAVFFRDLDNVGKFMGDEIHKQIEELTGIGGIMDDIKTMHSSIQQASATADRLSENLAKLKADIKKLQEACQTAGVSAPSSGAIDAIDITPLRDNVKKVAQKNVSKMVDDAAAELENIPTKTAEKAAPAVKTLKQNLDSKLKPLDVFQDVIYDARDGLVAKLPSKDTTDKFHDDVNRYGNQVIFQILFYLLVVTGLVVVFSMMGGAVLAMLSGLGGRDDVPDDIRMAFAERTSVMASVSGYMLQVALVLFFLYGWLLMTICTVLYILAPPTTKLLCEPVRDPSYTILDTLVDEHLYNGEGTFLGNMLNLSDGVLRVSDVLLGCKKNRAMYTAFLMDKSAQINFTKMLEFRDKLGVTDEINTINPKVDEFDLINDDVDAFLGDVSQLDSDTDTQVSEINSALTSTRAAVDPLAGPSSPSGVRTNAQNVQRSITTVQEDANALQQNFHDIGDPVSARVDKLKQDAQTSKDQISKKTPEAIKLAAATYKDRLLGIVDTLVNDTLDSVQNRYGKCRPLYNIWDALFVVSLCTNTMNILNGSWLALGWEHVFVLLASIPCYNLMGLVRRF